MATIDVLLPVRNGVQYLAESIESIQRQTFSDWRLLVLDHGSTDKSVELAHKYADRDKRIKVLLRPEADGLAGLLNFGLQNCDCRQVMRQDADDISLASRMEIITDLFESSPNILVAGGDAIVIDSVGKKTGYLRMPTTPAAVSAASFFYNSILHPTVSLNFTELRRFAAPYGKDILNAVPASKSIAVNGLAEDYLLFGQLAILGPCRNISVPLVKYRRHGESVGISSGLAQIEMALKISRFLAQSFSILRDEEAFDPAPFCNHGTYVFDNRLKDYSIQFARMSRALRHGLGVSEELERELAFRWILTTRSSYLMAKRYLRFQFVHGHRLDERLTVRNWLLRNLRKGKYTYQFDDAAVRESDLDEGAFHG